MNDNEPNTFSAIGLHAALILNRLQNLRALNDGAAYGKQDCEANACAAQKENEEPERGLVKKIGAR